MAKESYGLLEESNKIRFVPSPTFLTAGSQRPRSRPLWVVTEAPQRSLWHSLWTVCSGKSVCCLASRERMWLPFTINCRCQRSSKVTLKFLCCWGDKSNILWEVLGETRRRVRDVITYGEKDLDLRGFWFWQIYLWTSGNSNTNVWSVTRAGCGTLFNKRNFWKWKL